MPSVALHVVEFTFVGGFESLPLRQILEIPDTYVEVSFRAGWLNPEFGIDLMSCRCPERPTGPLARDCDTELEAKNAQSPRQVR
jgi:hypothetical protein